MLVIFCSRSQCNTALRHPSQNRDETTPTTMAMANDTVVDANGAGDVIDGASIHDASIWIVRRLRSSLSYTTSTDDASTKSLRSLKSAKHQNDSRFTTHKQIKGDLSDFGFNETQYDDFTAHLNPASDVDFEGVMAATAFNAIVFVVLMISYEILRRAVPSVYASKRRQAVFRGERMRSSSGLSLDEMDSQGDDNALPPAGSSSSPFIGFSLPLDWVIPVFQVSWSEVLESGGLDAYMFLRYIRLCLRITSVSAFWGIVILWPVYAKGGGPYDELSWYHFSMANIDQGSWRIWVPTVFIYLFSAYIFFAMKQVSVSPITHCK